VVVGCLLAVWEITSPGCHARLKEAYEQKEEHKFCHGYGGVPCGNDALRIKKRIQREAKKCRKQAWDRFDKEEDANKRQEFMCLLHRACQLRQSTSHVMEGVHRVSAETTK
jgi:hypothetical protein